MGNLGVLALHYPMQGDKYWQCSNRWWDVCNAMFSGVCLHLWDMCPDKVLQGSNKPFLRRDSKYGYSDNTIPENIYIFEVLSWPNLYSNIWIYFRAARILLCWVECMMLTGCVSMTCDGKRNYKLHIKCKCIWNMAYVILLISQITTISFAADKAEAGKHWRHWVWGKIRKIELWLYCIVYIC